MKKPAFSIGKIAPTPGLVNQFFNDFDRVRGRRRDRHAGAVE